MKKTESTPPVAAGRVRATIRMTVGAKEGRFNLCRACSFVTEPRVDDQLEVLTGDAPLTAKILRRTFTADGELLLDAKAIAARDEGLVDRIVESGWTVTSKAPRTVGNGKRTPSVTYFDP